MEHGEKLVDGIPIKYLCQSCPECEAKLEAAALMAATLSGLKQSFQESGIYKQTIRNIETALTAWEKAGKREP